MVVNTTPPEEVNKEIKARQEVIDKEIKEQTESISVLFEIRKLVQRHNEVSGINQVITDLAKLRELKEFYRSRRGGAEHMNSAGVEPNHYSATFEHNNKLPIDQQRLPATVRVNAISGEVIEELLQDENKIPKLIENLEDQRNEINTKTQIELPDNILEFLKNSELV